jgi:hypothetical protein
MKELDDLITYIENDLIGKHKDIEIIDEAIKKYAELYHKKQLELYSVSFELPSDEIFDMPAVNLKNPLEEFYYYERPPYLKSNQKDFKERLQKALNYLKGN